jgi:hypothetical protein
LAVLVESVKKEVFTKLVIAHHEVMRKFHGVRKEVKKEYVSEKKNTPICGAVGTCTHTRYEVQNEKWWAGRHKRKRHDFRFLPHEDVMRFCITAFATGLCYGHGTKWFCPVGSCYAVSACPRPQIFKHRDSRCYQIMRKLRCPFVLQASPIRRQYGSRLDGMGEGG